MRLRLKRSMGHRLSIMPAALLACVVCSATAQIPIRGPHNSKLNSPFSATQLTVDARPHPGNGSISNHAKEGAIIGGLTGGIALTVVGVSHCESDCTVGKGVLGFILGAALGAIPGALIGGAIPESP
jgi:hypothetical protein